MGALMEPLSCVTVVVLGGLFIWTLYNLPILAKGLRETLHAEGHIEKNKSFPKFSILVAAKNEELVLGRLLSRLVDLDYPRERFEVLVVEDGSGDQTAKIGCGYEAKFPDLIKFFHRSSSTGKPAALNYGLSVASGDIVAVLDADNVPARDFLAKAASHFNDPGVVAVQGMTRPINKDDNFITKLNAYEEAAWFRPYIQGKETLGLFVPLTGSCGFVRREFLQKLGGWDNTSIAEDIELAARIVKHKGAIRYAPDVLSFQEYPSSLRRFVSQRTRWFRGYMETFVKYGTLLKDPNRVSIDAEATLGGPLVLNLVAITYLITLLNLLMPSRAVSEPALAMLAEGATVLTAATLLICGVAIFDDIRPMRLRNLVWIPLVFAYWFLQTAIAARAFLGMVLKTRTGWVRTQKTGRTTISPEMMELA
jgi:cellulose synthase/poly-beta-1,6-N-acetylglucosamine synthase-like glycosyltransferase